MGKYIVLAALVALAACQSSSEVMKSWVGSPDSKLLSQWGAPDLEARGANGTRVLTYQGRNSYGQIICRRTFTVNAEQIITSWSHDCPL